MRYYALATDYDGTLASDGRVDEGVMDALRRLRTSGRKLILVAGRELAEWLIDSDLRQVEHRRGL